jgi:hypothetical protein
MKKVFLFASAVCTLFAFAACSDQKNVNTHQHEEGSTHSDHTLDTIKPQQQEFTVGDSTTADSSLKEDVHTHEEGKPHSH